MGSPIKFGTDGWRGVIAEDFTFDNVRRCAQGVADYVKESGGAERGIVIGYDNRFASEDFAAASAEVLAANGIRVWLTGHALPTPVVAFGVTERQAAGGIAITASHNPARWNGFKLRQADGSSAPQEVIDRVEQSIHAHQGREVPRLPLGKGRESGLVTGYDPVPAYLERVRRLVDCRAIRDAGLNIVVDPMYGVGAGYLRTLLEGGRTQLTEINPERNPAFPGINPEPIAVNLKRLAALVPEKGADVGIAHDGDADRIGIIDEHGRFLTQLQVFPLLCLYLLDVRRERGAIVKTLNSSAMLDRLAEMYQVPLHRVPVGFRYVAPVMLRENALIGGEESGGYGFRGHIPERDSVLAALYFLDYMVSTGRSPSQLLADLFNRVGPHYYHRVDVPFPAEQRPAIRDRLEKARPEAVAGTGVTQIDTRTDGYYFALADGSWLLIRFSGTEPLLRIYAESRSQEKVNDLLEAGQELAGI